MRDPNLNFGGKNRKIYGICFDKPKRFLTFCEEVNKLTTSQEL